MYYIQKFYNFFDGVCEICIKCITEKSQAIVTAPVHPLSTGKDNFQFQILKRGDQKKRVRLRGELLCYCQTRLFKIKYGFEGSISNVDFGLFQPKNQWMFSFVTFWLC